MRKQRLDRLELLLQQRENAAASLRSDRSLETPQDVLELLHEQLEALRKAPLVDPVTRARTVGYVAALALRTLQGKQLAERIEMLELVLKQRKDGKG